MRTDPMVAEVARRFPGKSFMFPLEHLSPASFAAGSNNKSQQLKSVLVFTAVGTSK